MRTMTVSARRLLVAQLAATALLTAALVVIIYFAFQTHHSLCTLRGELDDRVAASETYIDDVKEGRKPLLAGFTLAELERSVAATRQNADALSGLDFC